MKKIIFVILLFALWFPKIQENLELFHLSPLNGVTDETKKPVFTFKGWLDGKFQSQYEEFHDVNFGLRNFFIRLFNSFDFDLFKKTHSDVIVGKDDYLFQVEYVNEVTGKNFIGDDAMKENIGKIKTVQDYLDSKKVTLVTILAPGKTYYFKEFLPDYISNSLSPKRNYNAILKYGNEDHIRYIDFNKWFMDMKDTVSTPLFPKQGIHWGYYGMALAADSIIKFIEHEKNVKLPEIKWTLEYPDELRGTDYDLGDLLNVGKKLPYNKMAYPKFDIREDSGTHKLKVLVIGDSFYWTIYNENIFRKAFAKETFYYYNNTVHPEKQAASDFVMDLNLIKEVEGYDVILLLQSTANYGNPGSGFIQSMINDFYRLEEYKNQALGYFAKSKELSKRADELSASHSISRDSSIAFLADSLAQVKLENISATKVQMRNNPDWMQQLWVKGYDSKQPIEKVMQADAEWLYDQEMLKKLN